MSDLGGYGVIPAMSHVETLLREISPSGYVLGRIFLSRKGRLVYQRIFRRMYLPERSRSLVLEEVMAVASEIDHHRSHGLQQYWDSVELARQQKSWGVNAIAAIPPLISVARVQCCPLLECRNQRSSTKHRLCHL